VFFGLSLSRSAITTHDELQKCFVLTPDVSGFFVSHKHFTHHTLCVCPVRIHRRRHQQVLTNVAELASILQQSPKCAHEHDPQENEAVLVMDKWTYPREEESEFTACLAFNTCI
jgi:hypothetical protein